MGARLGSMIAFRPRAHGLFGMDSTDANNRQQQPALQPVTNVTQMSNEHRYADVGSHNDHSMDTLPTSANIGKQHILHESQHNIDMRHRGEYPTLILDIKEHKQAAFGAASLDDVYLDQIIHHEGSLVFRIGDAYGAIIFGRGIGPLVAKKSNDLFSSSMHSAMRDRYNVYYVATLLAQLTTFPHSQASWMRKIPYTSWTRHFMSRAGIAPVAINDRQLPFKYTIASRSTDVMVEGKSVSSYVLKMKGYVKQLERPVYVLPQDLSVGLILNDLTSDFVGFVRNYNMHNMGKTISELHALIIESEKGKGKGKGKGKDKSYIFKPKNPKPSIKERPAKDDACHHCKEVGHWKRNCPVCIVDLIKKKKKQVGTASSS
ncbi:reverse transcriptase domain-containing protein, partial [Tanacetum coccineum]